MSAQSTSPYKPSPLSFGSSRGSPFKRPQSPLAQSPSTVRGSNGASPNTPTASPEKKHGSPASVVFAPRNPPAQPNFQNVRSNVPSLALQHDPLSRLPPSLLHAMRESFHLLASNSAGAITRADVADMLGQLGQDASSASLNQFFPAGGQPQTLNLAAYLQTLAMAVDGMSAPDELSAAFAAFDVDDSGQVDVEELRAALLSVPGEAKLTEREIGSILDGFAGRRALTKGMGAEAGRRGEVFRYQEFTASILGGGKVESDGGSVAV